MDKLIIEGRQRLKGRVRVSGSKNACLPILAATMLTDEKSVIKGVPKLRDMDTMIKILCTLGAQIRFQDGVITVDPADYEGTVAPYELVSTMRASFCLLGALVAKKRFARVSLPGCCVIGSRPINLHLKGITALGVDIKIEGGYVVADGRKLEGADIYLGGPFGSSVLATANVMMAATLAKGTTCIQNAACEPEVVDLAEFLVKMGAKIKGHGSHTIEIEGVDELHGAEHTVIPDRIEAGTFIVAAAITRGEIEIEGARFEHLSAVVDKLRQSGVSITHERGIIKVKGTEDLKPIDATTLPYPGFPTDVQAQIMALMSITEGISIITEKIYPDRFMHVSELGRMGASIYLEGASAIVKGVPQLSGAPVMASDLRASAALVLAGMAADGRTDVSRVYHLDRGYERLEEKLSGVGAKIWREEE